MAHLKKEAQDFLIYSYFGIDRMESTSKEEIAVKCAYRAYLDLARTVTYIFSTSDLDNIKKKNSSQEDKDQADSFISFKTDRINNVCKIIIDNINCHSQNIQSADEFENWHSALCETIKNVMNCASVPILKKGNAFTYGQAQKWVNMTLKYLWLLGVLPEHIKPEYLHAPVDSFIIEAAKSNDTKYGLQISKCPIAKDAWSKWNSEDGYLEFQHTVAEKAKSKGFDNALQWEVTAWFEIAKKRAGK